MIAKLWTPSDVSARILGESDALDQLQANCWPYETRQDPATTRGRAADALEHLVKLGLPYAAAKGRRTFEPYEILNFLIWAHVRKGDALWAESSVLSQRRMVSEHSHGRDQRVTVTFEREIVVRGARGALFRTQLPLDISATWQSDATVRLRAGPGVDAAVIGDRIDARMRVGAAPTLTVGYEVELRCGWQGTVVEPNRVEPFRDPESSMAQWLSVSEGPIEVTSRLRSVARDLTEGASTPWEAVGRFWKYLYGTIIYGCVRYDRLEGPDVLSRVVDLGRADCWYLSAVLCGLCRARGIPARMVGGLFLYSPWVAPHYWCEIHVPPYGWVPCDFGVSWVCAAGSAENSTWSDWFLGRLEPRLVLERFPRRHILLGPRLPKGFFHQIRSIPDGTEVIFQAGDTGEMIYRDRLKMHANQVAEQTSA